MAKTKILSVEQRVEKLKELVEDAKELNFEKN